MTIKIQSITPQFQAGDNVKVKWSNNQTYNGVIRKKLRKNWGVEIQDKSWYYRTNRTSVPTFALIKVGN